MTLRPFALLFTLLLPLGGVAQENAVNVYSSRHYQTDEALYSGFTKLTGIKVNRIEAGEDALIERIRNEGARSPADVFVTVDAGRLWRAQELGLFQPVSAMAAEAARLRDLHPSEVAAVVRAMPLVQRRQLAAAMDDERLADVLEELPEAEQVRLVEDLDLERLVSVLEEMEYDDLADLLGVMSGEQRLRILAAMDADDADVLRRLLSYEESTAGGMMTPEIIVLGPTATVADALAEIRRPDWVVSIAAQVFVCHPPFVPPTGKLLGTAHVQQLLREPPSMELRHVVSDDPTVTPDATDREVAELLASYDMLAVAVCDEAGRLLGAVTVDDVLDRQLGSGWRSRGPSSRTRTA